MTAITAGRGLVRNCKFATLPNGDRIRPNLFAALEYPPHAQSPRTIIGIAIIQEILAYHDRDLLNGVLVQSVYLGDEVVPYRMRRLVLGDELWIVPLSVSFQDFP
jgi:hypothetical protein